MANDEDKDEGGPAGDRPANAAIMGRIDAVLKERRLSRAELARLTGFAPLRISRWFKGQGVPDLVQAAKISDALGVSLAWLAGREADEMPGLGARSIQERVLFAMASEIGVADSIAWLAGHPKIRPRANECGVCPSDGPPVIKDDDDAR